MKPRKIAIYVFVISSALFGLLSQTDACINPGVKDKDDSQIRATHFPELGALTAKQLLLLSSLFGHALSSEEYLDWTTNHNDQASTFIALTKTLAQTDLTLENGGKVSALDMVVGLQEIRGVRFIALVDLAQFGQWKSSGSGYEVHLAKNKNEDGDVTFADHSQKGGGLHCGYDIQGYTNYRKAPYIHWNVNLKTGLADIHLDGHSPWIGGIVPNPAHLTYANSDVRAWVEEYVKKYGDPGFETTSY